MAETKSDTKHLEFLIQNIANKINTAAALNGGFDKMLVIVEHIQEKQQETSEKVGNIHDGLYHPNDGLYARVKLVENATKNFELRYSEHTLRDERNMEEISSSLKKLSSADLDLSKTAETTSKLKRIAGEDLEKLDSVIRVKTSWSAGWQKMGWMLVAGGVGAVVPTIWALLIHR